MVVCRTLPMASRDSVPGFTAGFHLAASVVKHGVIAHHDDEISRGIEQKVEVGASITSPISFAQMTFDSDRN